MAWRVPLLAALVVVYGSRALSAAPDAAFVMDARTGEVLLAENADTALHPASLTKMMTLYLALSAVEEGRVDWDQPVRISHAAAAMGGASMGLVAGATVPFGDLVRATAVRSANDAAYAVAEAVAGTHGAFVDRMNAMAAAMGLTATTFRNAHGLTAEGHLTSARDMSVLGWRLLRAFPEHGALFSAPKMVIGAQQMAHTNRRFLGAYPGADGIKTGYTRAAGFTLTASATQGQKHLIVTVFGAASSTARAARAAQLMDWGFARVAEAVPWRMPPPLRLPAPYGRDGAATPLLTAVRPLVPLLPGGRSPPASASASGLARATTPALDARPDDQNPGASPIGGMALTALSPLQPSRREAGGHNGPARAPGWAQPLAAGRLR